MSSGGSAAICWRRVAPTRSGWARHRAARPARVKAPWGVGPGADAPPGLLANVNRRDAAAPDREGIRRGEFPPRYTTINRIHGKAASALRGGLRGRHANRRVRIAETVECILIQSPAIRAAVRRF